MFSNLRLSLKSASSAVYSDVSSKRMPEKMSREMSAFQHHVAVKFQLYNSLFLSLPFDRIEKTGILLQLFVSVCEEGFARKSSPQEIVQRFFADHTSIATEREQIDLLFRFVQYAERQVVLFDALEDAAFGKVNDLQGAGTLAELQTVVAQHHKQNELIEKLDSFRVRPVLTAHPTQFYPGAVLGIINDLTHAIAQNDLAEINTLLQQLGRTPFIKRQKPTPFDEAASLIWYLENVFYQAAGNIAQELNEFSGENSQPIKMGFWSGGDRDGNPFVTAATTLEVAAALSKAILRCYHQDVRALKRRLTFAHVEQLLNDLEQKLVDGIFARSKAETLTKAEIIEPLCRIRQILIDEHDNLFLASINDLIGKVELFAVHFAALDVRQEASVHRDVLKLVAAHTDALPKDFQTLNDQEKIQALINVKQTIDPAILPDELARDTFETVAAIKTIQQQNGAAACERYIISQTGGALDAVAVYAIFLLGGWRAEDLTVDIVPLFETVEDLRRAASQMRELYELPVYRQHLKRRGDQQTIMLGFSDGTKDGGYLAANFGIYAAKKELTAISAEHGVAVIFFDGRGGPPARGGGKTHRFYASMGAEIAAGEIQITIQGQTVSSNFGTIEAAQYNLEQLLHAGIRQDLLENRANTFSDAEENLMRDLASESFRRYDQLKNHPAFLDYLADISPLKFYHETNIGSRPMKRGAADKKLQLKDLRAIPFVGAWSQLKQNVPGFYGVGSALAKAERENRFDEAREMYASNRFFKALLDNCEMAMVKSFFPLTDYLSSHQVFGELWRDILDEYELTRKYLLEISGKTELMEDYPIEKASIETRERIMLPLTTIQQFALIRLREAAEAEALPETVAETEKSLQKIIVRCSFGIINAGRNSV